MSRRVARPYAAALYQVMRRADVATLRELEAQLAGVEAVLRRVPELVRVFEVPSVPPERKLELVHSIAAALELRPEAHRLLVALAHHVRLRFLPDVVAAFRELVDRREGIARGWVELPSEPASGQIEKLDQAFSALLAERIALGVRVRPELLAGFIVRVGSRLFDGSALTQVRRFAASAASE